MNNTGKIILSIAGFAVCAILGFFVTHLVIKPSNHYTASAVSGTGSLPSARSVDRSREPSQPVQANDNSSSDNSLSASSLPNGGALQDAPAIQTGQPVSDELNALPSQLPLSGTASTLEVLNVSKPVYRESDKTYSFTVNASGSGLVYGLADRNKKNLRTQDTPSFRVSATSSGRYFVYVSDGRGNTSEYYPVDGCKTIVKKIDASELQQVLNSGSSDMASSADFKNRVASNCRYAFNGRNDEEGDAPVHYNEIINRISMHTWSSVEVTSVSHDDSGKLTRAVISVKY